MECAPFWEYRRTMTLDSFKLFVQEQHNMHQGRSLQLLTYFLQRVSDHLKRSKTNFFGTIKLYSAILSLEINWFLRTFYHCFKKFGFGAKF